jgi:hypothetical protein
MKNRFIILLIVLCVSCGDNPVIGPENLSGPLQGRVLTYNKEGELTDRHDSVLINLTHRTTHDSIFVYSDSAGFFTVPDLPMGVYEMWYSKENYSRYYVAGYKHLGGTQTSYIDDVLLSKFIPGQIEIVNITYLDSDSTYYIRVDISLNNIPENYYQPCAVIFSFGYHPDKVLDYFPDYKISGYGNGHCSGYGPLFIIDRGSYQGDTTLYLHAYGAVAPGSYEGSLTDFDTLVYCKAFLSNYQFTAYKEYATNRGIITSIVDSSSLVSFSLRFDNLPIYNASDTP